jgi:hypothetical protein
MADQATSIAERFDTARGRIDEEVQRVQKQIQARRKQLERQLTSSRKSIEKQTRKQVKQLRGELSRSSVVQQLERIREDAGRQLEGALETMLGVLQIASKGDVQRIDRKLSKLNKKLKEMERTRRTNGQARQEVAQV